MRTIVSLILIVSCNSYAANLSWVSPSKLTDDIELNCKQARDFVKGHHQEVENMFKKGLTKVPPEAVYWVLKPSAGKEKRVFVSITSTSACGAGPGGCYSRFYVIDDSDCEEYTSPNLIPNSEIGFDGNETIYLKARKGCGVWKIGKNLTHKENLEEC